jgi:hypothetical protein
VQGWRDRARPNSSTLLPDGVKFVLVTMLDTVAQTSRPAVPAREALRRAPTAGFGLGCELGAVGLKRLQKRVRQKAHGVRSQYSAWSRGSQPLLPDGLTQINFGQNVNMPRSLSPTAPDSKPSISMMNTLVTYLIEFALIWAALMLAWTLARMTVRIIRSARKPGE